MGVEEVDLTGDVPAVAQSRKRKAKDISKAGFASSSGIGSKATQLIDLTGDDDDYGFMSPRLVKPKGKQKSADVDENETLETSKPVKKGKQKDGGEKRLRQYALSIIFQNLPVT